MIYLKDLSLDISMNEKRLYFRIDIPNLILRIIIKLYLYKPQYLFVYFEKYFHYFL